MLRVPLHIITILLEKQRSLKFDKVLHEILPCGEMLRTFINKLQSFLSLLDKVILCVLVEAVDKLNKVLFNQAEILADRLFQSFERLHHKVFLCILGSQSENVDHNTPSRFEILSL